MFAGLNPGCPEVGLEVTLSNSKMAVEYSFVDRYLMQMNSHAR